MQRPWGGEGCGLQVPTLPGDNPEPPQVFQGLYFPARRPDEPPAPGQERISSLSGAHRKRRRRPSAEEEPASSGDSEPEEAAAQAGAGAVPSIGPPPPAPTGAAMDKKPVPGGQPTAASARPRPPARPAVFIPVNRTPEMQVSRSVSGAENAGQRCRPRCTPVIPATHEAEAGGSQVPGQSGQLSGALSISCVGPRIPSPAPKGTGYHVGEKRVLGRRAVTSCPQPTRSSDCPPWILMSLHQPRGRPGWQQCHGPAIQACILDTAHVPPFRSTSHSGSESGGPQGLPAALHTHPRPHSPCPPSPG